MRASVKHFRVRWRADRSCRSLTVVTAQPGRQGQRIQACEKARVHKFVAGQAGFRPSRW
jgi:hypothetical protein